MQDDCGHQRIPHWLCTQGYKSLLQAPPHIHLACLVEFHRGGGDRRGGWGVGGKFYEAGERYIATLETLGLRERAGEDEVQGENGGSDQRVLFPAGLDR